MRLTALLSAGAVALAVAACSRHDESPAQTVQATPPETPYAVCAHVTGHEHALADRELALCREAGIGWVRSDFHWRMVEPNQGEWHFEKLDATVAKAKAAGIRLLPIITYVPAWAKPAGSHRAEWLEYVRRTVTRYKDDLRHWEVWNEPNLGYAWDSPDGKAYGDLLADTYRVIKAIDPGLTVLYGGTADIPLPFIEASLQAGAAQAFDVMNVHPYRSPKRVAELPADIAQLRALLERHGAGGRPLWFTELGWATQSGIPPMIAGALRAGLAALDPARTAWSVAVFDDPAYPVRAYGDTALRWMLPAQASFRRVGLDGLAKLDPAREQVLLMPPDEGVPSAEFDAIAGFVERGGILVLPGGVPFYNAWDRQADGTWTIRRNIPDAFRRRLRIGWAAQWNTPGVPAHADAVPVPRWAGLFPVTAAQAQRASRFLTPALLGDGDELIPLAQAAKDGWTGIAAAAIRYAGRGGGTVVIPLMDAQPGVSPDEQASLLVAAQLHALHNGVERFFWYELQSPEGKDFDKEDHFGLLHADLSPKPAWAAYRTLIRIRPPGSVAIASPTTGQVVARWGWRRPDGTTAWALWCQAGEQTVTARLAGPAATATDFQGRPITLPADGALRVGPAGLFLTGPTALDF